MGNYMEIAERFMKERATKRPASVERPASKTREIDTPHGLTDTEQQAVDGWLESIHELEPGWSEAQAQAKAMELLENSRLRREKRLLETAALYRERGWVRIYFTYLGRSIYLVRDSSVKVPNPSLPVYTESETLVLKGLPREELLTLHEARSVFGGKFSEGNSPAS
ncbi:MAG: hypothetical protein ACE5G9_13265 [Nitrospinales bacterium]